MKIKFHVSNIIHDSGEKDAPNLYTFLMRHNSLNDSQFLNFKNEMIHEGPLKQNMCIAAARTFRLLN